MPKRKKAKKSKAKKVKKSKVYVPKIKKLKKRKSKTTIPIGGMGGECDKVCYSPACVCAPHHLQE